MARNVEISLLKSRIYSLEFRAKSIAPKGKIPLNLEISHKYKYDYKDKTISVLVAAHINDEQMPFYLKVEYEGLFALNKRLSKKKAEPIANINCPAILFPFLREAVAEITRRGGFNPLMLPTFNFFEAAKEANPKETSQKGEP
ncbi:MAG: protein-export chaperone SecB [Deltaproteobacteria bacterium]|nr:protein-export chaperone SecB [Deltaproteobacteria bacterium]